MTSADSMTGRQQAEQSLRDSEARHRAVVETAVDGIIIIDATGIVRAYNPACERMFGFRPEEVIGQNVRMLMPEPYRAEHDTYLQHYGDTGERRIIGIGREVTGLRNDGSTFPLELSVGEATEGGQPIFVGVLRDITERKEAEQVIRDSEARHRAVVETAVDGIIIIDAAGIVRAYNPACERMFGFRADEVVNRNVRMLMPVPYRAEHDTYLRHHRTTGEKKVIGIGREVAGQRKDGSTFALELSVGETTQGDETVFVGVLRDITDRKLAEAELAILAQHDSLTGLLNRGAFFERLADTIANAHRNNTMCAVLHLDLDHFKHVNDSFGHATGDSVLREFATRLRGCLRKTDIAARVGGDEFLVIAPNVNGADGAAAVARKIVDNLNTVATVDGNVVPVSTSIGIALFPVDDGDAQQLVANADAALYKAKREGRGSSCFYDSELDQTSRRRRALRGELEEALHETQFELYYQPVIDVTSGAVLAAEALARWHHPNLGPVSPTDFIPLAEETGLIHRLGPKLLNMGCRQFVDWRDDGLEVGAIAVNLSAAQFRSGQLLATIRKAIELTAIAPDRLELEITESLLLGDLDAVSAQLDELSDLGIRLAIDDFGTGYSSLSYLQRLPIDRLKIDRSFVQQAPHDPDTCAIIEAIVSMAHKLRLEVTAEGVETAAQFGFLQDIGVTQMQGYFLSRPVDEGEFRGWYAQRHPCPRTAPNNLRVLDGSRA